MGGRASKQKGKRGEYNLRDALRTQGWTADRVYASGALPGMPGDVKAVHPKHGPKLFELKCRKETFKKIYALYEAHVKSYGDDLMALAIPADEGRSMCVNVSSSLEAVLGGAEIHLLPSHHKHFKEFPKTYGKIGNLRKLLGEAHILVVRDDYKPFLYFRFI
jgi:hypothetical protein